MGKQSKKTALMISYAALVGVIIAGIVWLYLEIANVGVTLIWHMVPDHIDKNWYTLILCVVGGLVIGLFQKKFGAYPKKMADAVKEVMTTRTFDYSLIPIIIVASLLSILFGGAIGPEAGLVSLLFGLAFWTMDQFGYARYQMELLVHNNPYMPPKKIFKHMLSSLFMRKSQIVYNKDAVRWKRSESILCGLTTGLVALFLYLFLNHFVAASISIPHLEGGTINKTEYWSSLLLIAIGIGAGYLYLLFKKLANAVFGMLESMNLSVLNAVLGGVVLGMIGTALPMTMFSGGADIQAMEYEYLQYTPVLLIVIGVVKLFLTNVCIESGWRGGHFFPVLFAGLSIGYGISLLMGINQVFCVVVVTGALLGTMLQQPIGALVLSVIFFPLECAPWMVLSCCVGGLLPVPKVLRMEASNEPFIKKIMKRKTPPSLPAKSH